MCVSSSSCLLWGSRNCRVGSEMFDQKGMVSLYSEERLEARERQPEDKKSENVPNNLCQQQTTSTILC